MGMMIVTRGHTGAGCPPPCDGPWSSGRDDAILADTIRQVPCGSGGLAASLVQGTAASPVFVACPLREREKPRLLLLPKKKKTKKHNHPPPLRTWGMGDCACRNSWVRSFSRSTSEAHILPLHPKSVIHPHEFPPPSCRPVPRDRVHATRFGPSPLRTPLGGGDTQRLHSHAQGTAVPSVRSTAPPVGEQSRC